MLVAKLNIDARFTPAGATGIISRLVLVKRQCCGSLCERGAEAHLLLNDLARRLGKRKGISDKRGNAWHLPQNRLAHMGHGKQFEKI